MVVLFAAYLGATLAGAPRDTLSLVFAVVVCPVPVVAWWAYRRAPANLCRTWLLCFWAATLWLVGSCLWYGVFVANGGVVPHSPGIWDLFLVAARLLLIAAIVVAFRSLLSLRLAALDVCVIVAATVAVGAAIVGRGLEDRVTAETLVTLNRPLLGIVTLILMGSAALGTWQGLPRSIVLLGLGEVGLTVGSLIYSYSAVQGQFVDDRWANLAWSAGVAFSVLGGSVLILGIDRPVRVPARLISDGSGFHAVLLLTLTAITLSSAVTLYGFVTDRRNVAIVGTVASATIAVAMAFRAVESIRAARSASVRLDDALADSEQARRQLDTANEQLQRKNAELRTLQITVAQGFNLIDERTQGRLRDLIEEAGDDLVALVDETFVDDD